MRLGNRLIWVFTTIFIFSTLLVGSVAMAASGTNTFTDHFIDAINCDAANTTAAWGDGSNFLHPPLTGVCAQSGATAAKDAAGNIVFAWNDWRSGTEAVYISKFNSSGVKLWDDKKVADGGNPKIACDSANNIYIAFNPGLGNPVYVYKYDANGTYLTNFRADTDAYPSTLSHHEIAIDTSNNLYIVFNCWITKTNSAGARLWGPVVGNDTGQYNPDVAIAGNYLYMSHHDTTGTGPFNMDVNRIDPANGNRLWASDVNVASGSWMRIAVETTGNVCATYSDNYSVFYKKLSSAGAVVAGPLTIESGAAYTNKKDPDISIDSSNNKYIIYKWKNSTSSIWIMKAQKLSSADVFLWGATGTQISYDRVYMGFWPVCAPTATGGVFGAWGERAGEFSTDNHDNLRANIISSAGTKVLTDDLCIHNAPEYAATAQGQSLTIDTVTENVKAATLTFESAYWLFGQTGTFYLTNNGGTNWYQVTPGTKFNFPVTGSDLRFKAVFSTTTRSLNPKAHSITIAYDYVDADGTHPYLLYQDTSWTKPLSGYMGTANGISLSVDTNYTVEKSSGSSSTKISYDTTQEDWAGIYCQYNGWGGPGLNLSGNKRLTFMAKSAVNGVKLKFGFDTQTATREQIVTLTTTWQRVTFDVATEDLSNINGLWFFSIAKSDNLTIPSPIVFYVDEVGYDEIPASTGDTTPPTGTPTIPTDAGAYSSSSSIAFNWTIGTSADPESGIAGYYLQVSTTTAFSTFIFNGEVGNVLTKTITGCTQGLTYYARVKAKNGVGLYSNYSGASNGIKIDKTAPTGTPSAPNDAGTYSGSASIVFNWTAGTVADAESGIAGYYLQVSTSTAFTTLKYNAYVGNVLTKTITGCIQGQTYYARVRARNGSGLYTGYSGASNGIKIDTTIPTGTPSVPSDQGVMISTTTIVFSWTKNTAADADSGISGYYLQVSTSTSFTPLKFNSYVGNVLTQTITGCLDGKTYYARVRARNGASLYGSYSGPSDGIKIQLSGSKVPYVLYSDTAWTNPLSGFMGSASGTSLTVDATYSTAPAQGTTCTKITYDKTKETWGGIYCLYNGWNGPGLNLTGNTKLTFKARANVAGVKVKFGMGASSSADTTIKDLPGSPVSLATTWTNYTIDLSSSNLTSINGLWYFSIAASDNTTITSPITFYVDEIYYTNSTTSAIQAMYAPSADFAEGETYVYPNPAKEGKRPTIHAEVGIADQVEIYIYDVTGELQESVELTGTPGIVDGRYAYEYQWDASDQASGVYIARIVAAKGSDKIKIIKKFAVVK